MLAASINLKCPSIWPSCRLGKEAQGKVRPVKVCFDSQEDARTTISYARNLKHSEKHSRIFIALDRSPEERDERRELVQNLRKRRDEEPDRFHFIYNGEICSREHRPRIPAPQHHGEVEISEPNIQSFVVDVPHSTLNKHCGILQEKLELLNAATEQAVSLTKSMIG